MKIKLYVSTNKVGSTCEDEVEIDDQDWAEMTDIEREKLMFEILCDSGMFEWNWEE